MLDEAEESIYVGGSDSIQLIEGKHEVIARRAWTQCWAERRELEVLRKEEAGEVII